MYTKLIRPLFFKLDPEKAHELTIGGLHAMGNIPGGTALLRSMYRTPQHPELALNVGGLSFDNPIGLAAGLDKNAEAVKGFSAFGFSFIEVGTVTPKPQPGNEKPRIFRLPENEALINRMGFNNEGADKMAQRLQALSPSRVKIAVNIGKNKVTPNEEASEDYRLCIRKLYTYADLFVVNISSPNTPNLRSLQHGEELARLLSDIHEEIKQSAAGQEKSKP
ncbi:MAG: dihydroorotate dehydrogenase (quinone), partial [Paenibacillus sp. RIFOXYA1_FULL_44_5]